MNIIDLTKLLEAGSIVYIELMRENLIKKFKSSVYRVLEDDTLYISSPIEKGMLFPLHVGESMLLTYNKENAGMYNFYVNVVSTKKSANLSMVILKKTSNIKKTQRRNYFRLFHLADIMIAEYDLEEEKNASKKEKYKLDKNGIIIEEIEDDKEYFPISIRNISGGGIWALSNKKILENQYVQGVIVIDKKSIDFKARVVRNSEIFDPVYKYELALEFYNLDDKIRADIISFIFLKERKLRSEEMIR